MSEMTREGFCLIPSATRPGKCSTCGKTGEVRDLDLITPDKEGRLEALCVRCMFDGPIQIPTKNLEVEVDPVQVVSHKRRKRVAAQERAMAETIGGRTQPASGALPGAKGDVRRKGYFRVECKSTINESFRLTRDVLDKISIECAVGEEPALEILFIDGRTMAQEDRWVCIKAERFEEYVEHVTHNHR